MTTIAAIQGDGWAVVGYDSQVTEMVAGGRKFVLPKTSQKVVKNGEYLIGSAGSLRGLNLLANVFEPPTLPQRLTKDETLDKFFCSSFIPALRNCFEENSFGKEGTQDSDILVIVRGKVYQIGSEYEWSPDQDGIYSIGSGSSFALGSLYTTSLSKKISQEQARVYIKQALDISSKLDACTSEPFEVVVQRRSTSS